MTTASDNSTAATPIASRGALLGILLGAAASGFVLAWGLGAMRGWELRDAKLSVGVSALAGTMAALAGILAGVAIVWSPGARTVRSLGLRVLASGSTRMMLALTVGVGLLITLEPESYTFFTALTVACFGALLGELAWAMSALRRAVGPVPSSTTIQTGAAAR